MNSLSQWFKGLFFKQPSQMMWVSHIQQLTCILYNTKQKTKDPHFLFLTDHTLEKINSFSSTAVYRPISMFRMFWLLSSCDAFSISTCEFLPGMSESLRQSYSIPRLKGRPSAATSIVPVSVSIAQCELEKMDNSLLVLPVVCHLVMWLQHRGTAESINTK